MQAFFPFSQAQDMKGFAEDGNLRFYLRFKCVFGIIISIFYMRMHDMHGGETHVR